jgi:hypothetical protein
MNGRLRCVVPGCRRTSPFRGFDEWVCGDHWRSIRKSRRRAYGRYFKRWRRYAKVAQDGSDFHRRAAKLWHVLKREAIERAMGI